uniref:Uncharacterized protein n=1 Tax=Tanacetum cinerariifolium TaxID=118510 RepID=A0A699I6N8_TANCI|nr:hypothetical protein [Tanacetum cinerariifolium]
MFSKRKEVCDSVSSPLLYKTWLECKSSSQAITSWFRLLTSSSKSKSNCFRTHAHMLIKMSDFNFKPSKAINPSTGRQKKLMFSMLWVSPVQRRKWALPVQRGDQKTMKDCQEDQEREGFSQKIEVLQSGLCTVVVVTKQVTLELLVPLRYDS